MTPAPKKEGNGQLNLNTVLLTICIGLSGWALKSIDELKKEMAGQIPIINANSRAIMGINGVQQEQSEKIGAVFIRLTILETQQSDRVNKKQ